MSETREAFRQRGEKLEELSDKSEQLANEAADFKSLARSLREKEQGRARFWGGGR